MGHSDEYFGIVELKNWAYVYGLTNSSVFVGGQLCTMRKAAHPSVQARDVIRGHNNTVLPPCEPTLE